MRIVLVAMLIACLAAAPATSVTTKPAPAAATSPGRSAASPTRRGSSDPAVSAVRATTLVLAKEYEQFLRSPGTGVRESSNYFKENPDDSVTPEAIVNAVAARGGGDPRTASYVRWQLLSALPDSADDAGELDPALAKQLLIAYRTAPQPLPR